MLTLPAPLAAAPRMRVRATMRGFGALVDTASLSKKESTPSFWSKSSKEPYPSSDLHSGADRAANRHQYTATLSSISSRTHCCSSTQSPSVFAQSHKKSLLFGYQIKNKSRELWVSAFGHFAGEWIWEEKGEQSRKLLKARSVKWWPFKHVQYKNCKTYL